MLKLTRLAPSRSTIAFDFKQKKYSPENLNSLNLIWLQQIPIWWRWFYWASPVSLTLYGLVTSQVGDIDSTVVVPGASNNITVKVFLKDYFGYDYEALPFIVVAHLCWVMFFVFGFAYGMKFINYQKR